MAKDIKNNETGKETLEKQGELIKNADEEKVIRVTRTLSERGKLILIVTGAIVFLAVAFTVFKIMKNRTYEGYAVVSSIETSGDSIADYMMFAGNVLKVSKDGASYIDEKGNVVWDCSYAMKMPKAVVSDDYAVVADLNGRDVYVFDKNGKISSQSMNYDIANVDVASQGLYALVLTADDCNYINGYDKDSKNVYEMKTSIENSGYPLDIAISDDGEKLFTSYIRIDGTTVPNYIAAYNFGSVGQNENADRLMGGFTFEDTFFPLVRFVDNDTAVCYGDNQIVIFTMPEKPSKRAAIDIGNTEMLGVFANSKYVGYIAASSDNTNAKYTIYIYNLDGKLETTADYNNSFDKVYATEDELIIVGDFDCCIYRFNGTKKFSAGFNKSLINIVPDANNLEYILIFENETQIIKLKRDKNEE